VENQRPLHDMHCWNRRANSWLYENYIKTINAVTAEDVLDAANKYFLIDNTRIIIAGGLGCYSGLEKLNTLIYFDKWPSAADPSWNKKATLDYK
jgi:predicted Zn-dependent peptidase